MKKYFSIILALLFVFTACACTNAVKDVNDNNSQNQENSYTNSSQQATPKPEIDNSKDSTSSKQNSDHKVTTSNDNRLNTPIDPTDKFFIKSNHTQLDKEKYYQYSFLSAVEKEAYRRIRLAVLSYNKTVEISDLNINIDRTQQIVECFFADNPQYFWVEESFAISHTGNVLLKFSDGVCGDNSEENRVDFAKIDERRKTFNQVVHSIVSKIKPTASQYEKELAIHDYLTKTTKYDISAAENTFVNNAMDSAYNSYGTLVENEGVCSGYAKAFQYLCYMVGINSNIVFGNAHRWNTVQIDGEWYQVDVTWDDPIGADGSSGDGNHDYFNLTSSQMYKAHPLTSDSWYDCIKIPNCTSTKNAYHLCP